MYRWIERVYGRKRKKYIKIHIAIDIKTKEIVAMEVTTDDTHESKVINKLVREASKHRVITKAYMDEAYDSYRSYKIKSIGIRAFIKPRRNTVKMINKYGEEIWSKMMVGYGKRLIIRQHSQHLRDYMGVLYG